MTFPLAQFIAFTESLEGKLLPFFYLDCADPVGFVTIGTGNLADPLSRVIRSLVFTKDGRPATTSEIQADWLVVKNAQHLRKKGGSAFEHLTTVRATLESMQAHVVAEVDRFEADLVLLFPCWDTWPDDAMIATMSMVWAMGDAKLEAEFPCFVEACRDEDWAEASRQCHMREDGQNASFRRRNALNAEMFARAGRDAVTRPEIA